MEIEVCAHAVPDSMTFKMVALLEEVIASRTLIAQQQQQIEQQAAEIAELKKSKLAPKCCDNCKHQDRQLDDKRCERCINGFGLMGWERQSKEAQ